MIRYLTRKEKERSRALYEACFPEDGKAFVDYYYREKVQDNQILVMEEAGDIQVMVHLNPFRFSICKAENLVHYVVAVATEASVRRQGKMAEVLHHALKDLAGTGEPFAFLIPANPEVYVSSGFSYVPCETYGELGRRLSECAMAAERGMQDVLPMVHRSVPDLQAAELGAEDEGFILRKATAEDIPSMVSFANEQMARVYDVFPLRDAAYYERMFLELESQDGGLLLLEQEDEEEPSGIISYGRDGDSIQLQELLILPEFAAELPGHLEKYFSGSRLVITKMQFMVRILDIRALVNFMRCREPFSLKVKVKDGLLSNNCGSFMITAGPEGGGIREIQEAEVKCEMDISELTAFLFRRLRLFIREWV